MVISFGEKCTKQTMLSIVIAVLAITISIPAYAVNFFTDRASWEAALPASFAPVDVASQVPAGHTLPAGSALLLPFGETLRFDINVQGAFIFGSGVPLPALLNGSTSPLDGTFGAQPVVAFGFDMESDAFGTFNFTLTTTDGGSQTLTQTVTSPILRFFGWIGDATSMQITCSNGCAGIGGTGFVVTNLVLGGFSGTPGKSNCRGQSVSALTQKYGGMDNAAATLGFPSVTALQNAIKAYCGS